MYSYPIDLTPDSAGSVLVTFPDFPEAATFGANEGEAIVRARDAIETAIIGRMSDGEDIPVPRQPRKGQWGVALSTLSGTKIALYQEMRVQGLRKADLARRLKCDFSQVARLLDLRHASRMDQIDAALAALNKQIDFQLSGVAIMTTTVAGRKVSVPLDPTSITVTKVGKRTRRKAS